MIRPNRDANPPDLGRCNACGQRPEPNAVVYDLPGGAGRSVACSDYRVCVRRAKNAGIYCMYVPMSDEVRHGRDHGLRAG